MSKFTTRVELYGSPSFQDYEKLHTAMGKEGFHRILTDGDKNYYVPHAEYLSSHNLTSVQVLELAKLIALTVWKDYCVLVTTTEVRWEHYNLKPATV